MSNKVRGRFYFKKTTNGNLVGEWSNNQDQDKPEDKPYTESADLINLDGNKTDGFHGVYHSTWQENQDPKFAILTIKPHKNNSKLFSLTWELKDGCSFAGKAMLCDEILIGDYHSGK